jgi:hypothetical protein
MRRLHMVNSVPQIYMPITSAALTTSKCVSPTGPKGVLTVLNQIRAKFK